MCGNCIENKEVNKRWLTNIIETVDIKTSLNIYGRFISIVGNIIKFLLLVECQSYVTLTSANRSVNNDKPGASCDDKLPRGWYRFAGPAGNMMPTTCVPKRHCGTHAPGWFYGAHPAVLEGAVRRDVCFSWKSCCSWRNSILVRNCGSFYVYYLSPPMTCNLGYCGNGQQGAVLAKF